MNIIDLPLPKKIVKKIASIETFETLNPPQEEAVNAGLFEKKNLLISIPTASGKTFIAEICAIQHILIFKSQVIYLSPLKALASEKFNDFKRFKPLGLNVGITVGDFDSADDRIDRYDVLVSTNEKIDSILRHRRNFIKNISLLIVDECHLIDDATRGPTLETLIVKIKLINPLIQILALSATVSNAKELANWLEADLIESNWRSVPLKEYYIQKGGEIISRHHTDRKIDIIEDSPIISLIYETLSEEGQVLVFANSRKRAQSIANSLKDITTKFLNNKEIEKIKTSILVLKKNIQLKDKTSLLLINFILHGVAFHHAGLNTNQRHLVESLFKSRSIKVIVATPTLAAGINLPARRVIIANLWRYSSSSGIIIPIKILEYEQMRGRAGRPKYDKYGESFIIAQTERDQDIILSKYFSTLGPERIESKLAVRPTLRIHVLGAISTGIVSYYNDIKLFLESSFFGHQYQDFNRLETILNQVLDDLESFNFILIKNESIEVTRIGRRVSQLYIDPVTANILIKGLLNSISLENFYTISFLHLFCLVPDINRIRLKKNDWGRLDTDYEENKNILLSNQEVIWNYNYQTDLEAYKTAQILSEWIEEIPLSVILTKYDLSPGDFQRLIELSVWISYSTRELIKELIHVQNTDQFLLYYEKSTSITNQELINLLKFISGIHIRLNEGIKKDLLEIIDIKGLGRVKARILAKNGIRNKNILIKTPNEKLLQLRGFGPKLIINIMEQLGIKTTISEDILTNHRLKKKSFINVDKPKTLFDYLK